MSSSRRSIGSTFAQQRQQSNTNQNPTTRSISNSSFHRESSTTQQPGVRRQLFISATPTPTVPPPNSTIIAPNQQINPPQIVNPPSSHPADVSNVIPHVNNADSTSLTPQALPPTQPEPNTQIINIQHERRHSTSAPDSSVPRGRGPDNISIRPQPLLTPQLTSALTPHGGHGLIPEHYKLSPRNRAYVERDDRNDRNDRTDRILMTTGENSRPHNPNINTNSGNTQGQREKYQTPNDLSNVGGQGNQGNGNQISPTLSQRHLTSPIRSNSHFYNTPTHTQPITPALNQNQNQFLRAPLIQAHSSSSNYKNNQNIQNNIKQPDQSIPIISPRIPTSLPADPINSPAPSSSSNSPLNSQTNYSHDLSSSNKSDDIPAIRGIGDKNRNLGGFSSTPQVNIPQNHNKTALSPSPSQILIPEDSMTPTPSIARLPSTGSQSSAKNLESGGPYLIGPQHAGARSPASPNTHQYGSAFNSPVKPRTHGKVIKERERYTWERGGQHYQSGRLERLDFDGNLDDSFGGENNSERNQNNQNNNNNNDLLFGPVPPWTKFPKRYAQFYQLVKMFWFSVGHISLLYFSKIWVNTMAYIHYILSQIILLFFLALRLFIALRHSCQWLVMAMRLVTMATLVTPMWLVMMFRYCGRQVVKGVQYGPNARNFVDIYMPPSVADEYHMRKNAVSKHKLFDPLVGKEKKKSERQLQIGERKGKGGNIREHGGQNNGNDDGNNNLKTFFKQFPVNDHVAQSSDNDGYDSDDSSNSIIRVNSPQTGPNVGEILKSLDYQELMLQLDIAATADKLRQHFGCISRNEFENDSIYLAQNNKHYQQNNINNHQYNNDENWYYRNNDDKPLHNTTQQTQVDGNNNATHQKKHQNDQNFNNPNAAFNPFTTAPSIILSHSGISHHDELQSHSINSQYSKHSGQLYGTSILSSSLLSSKNYENPSIFSSHNNNNQNREDDIQYRFNNSYIGTNEDNLLADNLNMINTPTYQPNINGKIFGNTGYTGFDGNFNNNNLSQNSLEEFDRSTLNSLYFNRLSDKRTSLIAPSIAWDLQNDDNHSQNGRNSFGTNFDRVNDPKFLFKQKQSDNFRKVEKVKHFELFRPDNSGPPSPSSSHFDVNSKSGDGGSISSHDKQLLEQQLRFVRTTQLNNANEESKNFENYYLQQLDRNNFGSNLGGENNDSRLHSLFNPTFSTTSSSSKLSHNQILRPYPQFESSIKSKQNLTLSNWQKAGQNNQNTHNERNNNNNNNNNNSNQNLNSGSDQLQLSDDFRYELASLASTATGLSAMLDRLNTQNSHKNNHHEQHNNQNNNQPFVQINTTQINNYDLDSHLDHWDIIDSESNVNDEVSSLHYRHKQPRKDKNDDNNKNPSKLPTTNSNNLHNYNQHSPNEEYTPRLPDQSHEDHHGDYINDTPHYITEDPHPHNTSSPSLQFLSHSPNSSQAYRTCMYDGSWRQSIIVPQWVFSGLSSTEGTNFLQKQQKTKPLQQLAANEKVLSISGISTLPMLPVKKALPVITFFAGGAWIISHRLWAGWLLSSLMNLTIKKRIYTQEAKKPQTSWDYCGGVIYSCILQVLIFACAGLIDMSYFPALFPEPEEVGSDLHPASNPNDDDKDKKQNSPQKTTLSQDIQNQIKNLDDFVLEECTNGFVCFALDYRNFPQGQIFDMVTDFTNGINWVINNAHLYGGDVDKVFVMGQSAGAHILILSALQAYANLKRLHQHQLQLCSVGEEDLDGDNKARSGGVDDNDINGNKSGIDVIDSNNNSQLFGPDIVAPSPYTQFTQNTNPHNTSQHGTFPPSQPRPRHEVPQTVKQPQPELTPEQQVIFASRQKQMESLSELPCQWLLKVCALVLLSGPFNLLHAKDTFYKNGLSPQVLYSIMQATSEEHLLDVSPCHIAAKLFGFDESIDNIKFNRGVDGEVFEPGNCRHETQPVETLETSAVVRRDYNGSSINNHNHSSHSSQNYHPPLLPANSLHPPSLQNPPSQTFSLNVQTRHKSQQDLMKPSRFSGQSMSDYEIDEFRAHAYSNIEHLGTSPHLVPSMVFPPCFILHGSNDKTVDALGALQFYHLLRFCGHVRSWCDIFLGISHTDLIIELCATGSDPLVAHLQHIVSFSLWKRHVSQVEYTEEMTHPQISQTRSYREGKNGGFDVDDNNPSHYGQNGHQNDEPDISPPIFGFDSQSNQRSTVSPLLSTIDHNSFRSSNNQPIITTSSHSSKRAQTTLTTLNLNNSNNIDDIFSDITIVNLDAVGDGSSLPDGMVNFDFSAQPSSQPLINPRVYETTGHLDNHNNHNHNNNNNNHHKGNAQNGHNNHTPNGDEGILTKNPIKKQRSSYDLKNFVSIDCDVGSIDPSPDLHNDKVLTFHLNSNNNTQNNSQNNSNVSFGKSKFGSQNNLSHLLNNNNNNNNNNPQNGNTVNETYSTITPSSSPFSPPVSSPVCDKNSNVYNVQKNTHNPDNTHGKADNNNSNNNCDTIPNRPTTSRLPSSDFLRTSTLDDSTYLNQLDGTSDIFMYPGSPLAEKLREDEKSSLYSDHAHLMIRPLHYTLCPYVTTKLDEVHHVGTCIEDCRKEGKDESEGLELCTANPQNDGSHNDSQSNKSPNNNDSPHHHHHHHHHHHSTPQNTILFCDCVGIQYLDGMAILPHSNFNTQLVPHAIVQLARKVNPF